jgi:bifunctional DNA-binding transcriptional regulator/antitoxin component of YhaV-PrlF toxin-antitoxin module
MVQARVTASGQISLPAEVRRRWGAKVVMIVDSGDRLVVWPVPDDPVSALRGKYASIGTSSADMRREARAEDRAGEDEGEAAGR